MICLDEKPQKHPNSAPMELPNGLSPVKVQGLWFDASYCKPFFG